MAVDRQRALDGRLPQVSVEPPSTERAEGAVPPSVPGRLVAPFGFPVPGVPASAIAPAFRAAAFTAVAAIGGVAEQDRRCADDVEVCLIQIPPCAAASSAIAAVTAVPGIAAVTSATTGIAGLGSAGAAVAAVATIAAIGTLAASPPPPALALPVMSTSCKVSVSEIEMAPTAFPPIAASAAAPSPPASPP